MRFEPDELLIVITSLLPLFKFFKSVSAPSVGRCELVVVLVGCDIKTFAAVLDAIVVSSEMEESHSATN